MMDREAQGRSFGGRFRLEFGPLEFVPLEFAPLEFAPLEFVRMALVRLKIARLKIAAVNIASVAAIALLAIIPLAAGLAPAQAAPPTSVSAAGITLRSAKIELPASDRAFPGGAAADVVTGNCGACHSSGMILNQPAMSETAWRASVNKMRDVFKAPIAEADVTAIVAYLTGLKPVP